MDVTMIVKKLSAEDAEHLQRNPDLIEQSVYGSSKCIEQSEPSLGFTAAAEKYFQLEAKPDRSLIRRLFGMKPKDVLPEPWPDEAESVTRIREEYRKEGRISPKYAAMLEMIYWQEKEKYACSAESENGYNIWSDPEVLDLDKSYVALHFLLTGRTEKDFLENNSDELMIADLLNPDCKELGWLGEQETGGGWLNPEQVKEMDVFLSNLSEDDLRKRFDPEVMDAKQIDPTIWVRDGEEGFKYCLIHFQNYQKFVKTAAEEGMGLWHLIML